MNSLAARGGFMWWPIREGRMLALVVVLRDRLIREG